MPISNAPEPPLAPPSSVPAYRRTTMKEQLAHARELLTGEERELLILRVDRGLSWMEIVTVLCNPGEDVGRASAALRKRFERTLTKLRRVFEDLYPSTQTGPGGYFSQ